ncbi:MAG: protein kinase [Moorea sp. SIO2B7]|nr:protein kinase [Moorena sp. SIO2B7]
MSYCLNPECPKPYNQDQGIFCLTCGSPLLLINRYRAIEPIGKGGMGRTFLGIDDHMPSKPHCAIKQLYLQHQSPAMATKVVELFEKEAVRLDQLGVHPQIPDFLAHFEQNGQLYIVQEWIEGHTLARENWKGSNLELQIWQILEDLLPIIAFIHEHQVIHRDIKPDNIMRRQSDRKLVLIDFGIARLFTHTAMIGGATIVGTPEYMAPEQTRGKVLPASDLYSLGVTCLRLLTEVSPLEMFDVIDEQWRWRDYLPLGSNISERLGNILDRLVQPSLRQRYRSATEVLQTINTTSKLTTIQVRKTSKPTAREQKHAATQMMHPRKKKQSVSGVKPKEKIPSIKIDYSKLKMLLLFKQWKKADQETWGILCQLAGKPIGGYLFNNDIRKLPCEHLEILDQLWVKHSRGRFGFSVQKRIYEEVGGEYNKFCDRIGWQLHRSNTSSSDSNFQFTGRSPVGHLPSRRWIAGYAWWQHAQVLAAKLDQCGIDDR